MDVVNIKQDTIIFPKYIRAVAKCSQQNAAEGTNLLVWIADEFSAFSDKNNKSNAMEMFNTLRTSSTTRFQNYGKGFVISFTRYKNDPILKLIDMYKDLLDDKKSTELLKNIDKNRERRYLFYEFTKEDHMVEMVQKGKAWDETTLVPTGKEFNR